MLRSITNGDFGYSECADNTTRRDWSHPVDIVYWIPGQDFQLCYGECC